MVCRTIKNDIKNGRRQKMFNNLEEYNKERNRLINEEGMEYIDACNKAWTLVMESEIKK